MSKETSRKVASRASALLKSDAASPRAKSSAGSVLSQRGAPEKVTSARVASRASRTLQNPHTTRAARSAAGSALSQRPRKRGR